MCCNKILTKEVTMKTQGPHIVALELDQLFRLLLTFAGEGVSTGKCDQGTTARYRPALGASRINDYADALPSHPRPSRRSWVVVRAFVTLLLTIRERKATEDNRQPQNSGLANRAVFVARYGSP
jgi:hypothetical protein